MKGPMGSEVGDTHLKPGGRIHPGCLELSHRENADNNNDNDDDDDDNDNDDNDDDNNNKNHKSFEASSVIPRFNRKIK